MRSLEFARRIADAQVWHARGRKAARDGRRPHPPKDCTDPAAWWAGWNEVRRTRGK